MFSRFFIDRPVFASVLSIIIVLGGLVSIWNLPIEQFPEITPPTVSVTANYPGASAEVVAQSLAAPIEQELSGAKHLLYYQTQCSNDGSLNITVTFETGTDVDLAAVEVQNRVARATPRLPQEATRQGISVLKRSTAILFVASLQSDDPAYDELFLNNYATLNIVDTLKRVQGAGDVTVFGAKDYSMRLWLNPDRMAAMGMTVTDVANAVREQNGQYAAGQIGQSPSSQPVQMTFPVITRGRLVEPEEFEDIILRANPDGSMVRVKDIGRAELGAQSYTLYGRRNAKPTTLILLYLQPGANALDTVKAARATMDELALSFPKGVKYSIPFDTTIFVRESAKGVIMTLLEAVVLVLIVVYLFLQSWRASLIPLLAVPVSIIGTFAGMIALGFSINTLTLFGLVLAIGIVVDDAIVVVENVERIMHDEGLPVREATIKAMDEVTGPVIAIVLVLSAVFVPVAFLGGLTGQLYKQFAVTIAVSVAISGLVALTLSPALCRLLLKPQHGEKRGFFKYFNRTFEWITNRYVGITGFLSRRWLMGLLLYGILCFTAWRLYNHVPASFLPSEDQGYFVSAVVLPDGASQDRTNVLVKKVEQYMLAQPEIRDVIMLGGMNLLGGGNNTNAATMFVQLQPWSQRRDPKAHVLAVTGRIMGHFSNAPEGMVLAFNPPAIRGLGLRAGFEMQLQARQGQNVRDLAQQMNDLLGTMRTNSAIDAPSGTLSVGLPQLFLELNRDKAKMIGVPIASIFDTLQAFFGSLYVNDFNKYGRTYRVQLQAEPEFRNKPEDIARVYVRNPQNDMVPLSELMTARFQGGPNLVSRFNGFPSVQITGAPAAGVSSGQAMQAASDAVDNLPEGYGFEWSGVSYQEIKAGNQAPVILGFGLIVVFLVLAAQYEKWTLPFAVLLAVPLGMLGASLAVFLRGMDRDIYFQIGLLTLVGLSAKNAILIIEFCVVLKEQGLSTMEAALQAARLRFRPIIMTSLAFILGVVPLVRSHGAGAAGRQSIGTGVMGGMIGATVLAVFFVPMFYVIIQRLMDRKKGAAPSGASGGAGQWQSVLPANHQSGSSTPDRH